MKKNLLLFTAIISLWASVVSCKKNTTATPTPVTPEDTTGTLTQAALFPMGIGINATLFTSNTSYQNLVRREFTHITLENELKMAALYDNTGNINFSNADGLVNAVTTAGYTLHGHAPIWYLGNNTTYLNSLTQTTNVRNAIANPGFESGAGDIFTNWYTQVSSTPPTSGSITAETSDVFAGSRSMKVIVNTPGPDPSSIQIINDLFPTVPGATYTLSLYAKAATNGSQCKLVIQNNTYQEKIITLTNTWQKYSWTFGCTESALQMKIHFPNAGTFLFDSVYLAVPISGNFLDPARLDSAMKSYLTNVISRYNSKIHSWDVVNEPLADNTGKLRTNPAGAGQLSTGETFYWADFMGESYIANAFRYAHAADPTALLFINEDKLESDGVKLDSMVALINRLKAEGVPINGVGVEMHTTIKNDPPNVTTAFQKLAATGLLIRVSEMDVRINPWNTVGYTPTTADLASQAYLYKYIAESYYSHVPAAQRYGITVWDLTDNDSWIVTDQHYTDFPTIFNGNYSKKPAYYGLLTGLKAR